MNEREQFFDRLLKALDGYEVDIECNEGPNFAFQGTLKAYKGTATFGVMMPTFSIEFIPPNVRSVSVYNSDDEPTIIELYGDAYAAYAAHGGAIETCRHCGHDAHDGQVCEVVCSDGASCLCDMTTR